MAATFEVIYAAGSDLELIRTHTVGTSCTACWPYYPQPCKCGGLIHANWADEFPDGPILAYRCEQCGDQWDWLAAAD